MRALVLLCAALCASRASASLPVLEAVLVSPTSIHNGGTVTLRVKSRSSLPVTVLGYTLREVASRKVLSGGSGFMPAMQDAADATLWFTTAHLRVSSWQSGAYSISDVFVANENHDSSSFWPSELGFSATTDAGDPSTPLITRVTVTPAYFALDGSGPLVANLTVTATSAAPVDTLDFSYGTHASPSSISGGGGYMPFAEVDGTWECVYPLTVSAWQPAGEYVVSHVRVANVAHRSSSDWPTPVTFTVSSSPSPSSPLSLTGTRWLQPQDPDGNGRVTVSSPARLQFEVLVQSQPAPNMLGYQLVDPDSRPRYGGGGSMPFSTEDEPSGSPPAPRQWRTVVTVDVPAGWEAGLYTFKGFWVRDEALRQEQDASNLFALYVEVM